MKIKTLVTGLAVLGACSALTLHAELLKIVTITLTTTTQNTEHDNGPVTTFAKGIVNTFNTQSILNLLAQDKRAEGQWTSSTFPAGAKLASSNSFWLVLDKADNVLADVSDIFSGTHSGNEVQSGAQNDATQLASPSLKTMEVIEITFDDTAIAGGNNISFSLQGLSTKTVTDTTPTAAGVYTETQTGVITGAAGTGTWSNGTPFVLTANLTSAGKATFGQGHAAGYAPASLAGYAVTVSRSGKPSLTISFGNGTWAQTGASGDTNADDFCAGTDTYIKTGPDTAVLSNMDIGMLSYLGATNYTTCDLTFTSATSGSGTWSSGQDSGTFTITSLKPVSDLVPASLAGKTLLVAAKGTAPMTVAFANNGTYTTTKAGVVTATGTYTMSQFSPIVAILELHETESSNAGASTYVEATFTSATAGQFFDSYYQNPAYGNNPDQSGPGAFTVK